MARSKKENAASGVKPLKILVTIVYWKKMDSFIDFIEEQEVNMQMIVQGNGTSHSWKKELFGLKDQKRAVIISTIREDKEKSILEMLEDKFERLKDSEGIAFTIPMESVIGVAVYQFLSNQKEGLRND